MSSLENKQEPCSEVTNCGAEDDVKFCKPTRQVNTLKDVMEWTTSNAFATIVGFIMDLNKVICGRKRTSQHHVSEKVQSTVDFLIKCKDIIDEVPPQQQAMRFGNKAFRDWHARVVQEAELFQKQLLGEKLENAYQEVSHYFCESFGNLQRIDYGTGHELNFVAWLCCLSKLEVFLPDDRISLVFDIFCTYLEVMRKVQTTYWLEPAGSKGVWGLDDYQFLPFYWGASQMLGQEDILPSDAIGKVAAEAGKQDNLFLACIAFVYQMKTGLFAEHSPLLNDISQVPSWTKVNGGLLKMYFNEVLCKFPVVQHFYFGSLLALTPTPPEHPIRQKAFRQRTFGEK